MIAMTFNIKYDDDREIGDITWENRKDNIVSFLEKSQPDVIGMQEVMEHQYEFLTKRISNIYSGIYFKRYTGDNPRYNNEACPIFYNKSKFNLVKKGVFWLSETPDIESINWESRHYRICTYAILEDKQTKKQFAFFNTHLDHKSELAKENGIKVIIKKIKELDMPSVLTGDFNVTPDSVTYKICDENLVDANKGDNQYTFHFWEQKEDWSMKILDYMFTYNLNAKNYKVLKDKVNDKFLSDHYPLSCELEL